MSLERVRLACRLAQTELYPEREWLSCPFFVEGERSFAAVVALAGDLYLYVYSDPYTLAAGAADSVLGAVELMLPRGERLVTPAVLEAVKREQEAA